MVAAAGIERVTARAEQEQLLLRPEIARRMVRGGVRPGDPANYVLREADGAAVFIPYGRHQYYLLAPSVEEASAHARRVIQHMFTHTDALSLYLDSENDAGLEFGGDLKGPRTLLTQIGRHDRPVTFKAWRVAIEPWLLATEAIRVEGGRLRRPLVKAGAVLGNLSEKDKDGLDRRLGFLSLAAQHGQHLKAVALFNQFAVHHAVRSVQVLSMSPIFEAELLGVRVRIVDGRLDLPGGAGESEKAA